MAFSNTYVFGFATTVCIICSVTLAGLSQSLREMQDLNKKRDVQSNILGALGMNDGSLTGEMIDKKYAEAIQERFILPDGSPASVAQDQDKDGDLDLDDVKIAVKDAYDAFKAKKDVDPEVMAVFVRMDGDKIGGAAIPLSGMGLWGPISGYLALDPKGEKVVGTAFFAPKETPGLGAEIVNDNFKAQWKGKSLTSAAGPKPIQVVKGQASVKCPKDVAHCVDGVAGATITSDGVTEMVALATDWYGPFLKKLNKGGVK